ncbi:MAG: hypothetical protein IKT16_06095 [Desulfovibrio sp.]|nr:hypothetical protein [Desulfovibrio sp.]
MTAILAELSCPDLLRLVLTARRSGPAASGQAVDALRAPVQAFQDGAN